ncbi:iron chelate uptake ABC transporter family permease subunit [Nakamurella sp. YIM 132087]|uniref:Iron chelate uptake ABC transporter family permease subunit n=1 Tax=Nakamurella alba TaxID=2665158 RepID=A0A7K1FL76_9ACTN|nr:iron chelate uptake ABC transporter family permease subunit [Nakamurella alba]
MTTRPVLPAWAAATAVLLLSLLAGLTIGSNPLSPAEVWSLLLHPDGSFDSEIFWQGRVPRTLLLLVVGAALAVAGAMMQSLTRNPLADPGIFGINQGAALAVVLAVVVTGRTDLMTYLWFAFAGAAAAAVAVTVLGGAGRPSDIGGPVRLALAGVAVSAALGSLVQTLVLADADAFNEFRFWAAGSAEGRGFPVLWTVLGFLVIGMAMAFGSARSMNALALGDDTGRALGVRLGRTRITVMVAVALCCGAATAAVGPIAFLGLAVPHLARALTGPDLRRMLPVAVVLGGALLLLADVIGRVVAGGEGEVQVGIVTALLGGPVFVLVARSRRVTDR